MKITIHRGSDEIGGTCIEVATEKTSILLDLGRPLDSGFENEGEGIPESLGKFDAVLVSHPHQDHYGLIEHVSPDIPVYMGELGTKFIQAVRLFLDKELLKNDFRSFEAWKPFQVGDMKITPYLVDHSAADAYSFLIEGDGKKVFYSGDFRGHGRKAKLFESMIKVTPKDIDLMLMEGTMLERENTEFPDERSVEETILEHLKGEPGMSFLIASGQNIDRIVTAYRASKRAGRIFVVDIYTAWILKELSCFSDNTPTIEWKDIRVLSKGRTAANHYIAVKENPEHFEGFIRTLYKEGSVITHEELKEEPERYFLKVPLIKWLIDELDLKGAGVVYSQWKGYMSEEYNPKGFIRFKELKEDPRVNFTYAHTSGHAVLEDLKRLSKAIAPKMLVPVHTEHKENYSEHFENVRVLRDGEVFIL